jgi:hypothetical protein
METNFVRAAVLNESVISASTLRCPGSSIVATEAEVGLQLFTERVLSAAATAEGRALLRAATAQVFAWGYRNQTDRLLHILVSSGALLDSPEEAERLLTAAARVGRLSTVKALVNAGAACSWGVVEAARREGQQEVVDYLENIRC